MPNLINNDTVNNITYLNYFDSLTNGEINLFTDQNSINVRDACNTRWGSGTCANLLETSSRYLLYAFPNATEETQTNRTPLNSRYRIAFHAPSMGQGVSTGFPFARLNSNNSTGTTLNLVSVNAAPNINTGIANCYEYAIITDRNITMAGFASTGANLNTAVWRFISTGWLFDSAFSGSLAVRGLYSMYFSSQGHAQCFRVSAENITTAQTILTTGDAQYPVTCASDTGDGTTPAADLWASTLWLRDSPGGFAVGRIPHVLLCKTTTLQLGQLVKINTTIDGITDQKIWLVAANYGADKLLMRVYTEGIS